MSSERRKERYRFKEKYFKASEIIIRRGWFEYREIVRTQVLLYNSKNVDIKILFASSCLIFAMHHCRIFTKIGFLDIKFRREILKKRGKLVGKKIKDKTSNYVVIQRYRNSVHYTDQLLIEGNFNCPVKKKKVDSTYSNEEKSRGYTFRWNLLLLFFACRPQNCCHQYQEEKPSRSFGNVCSLR